MSCFLVSSETINVIVGYVLSLKKEGLYLDEGVAEIDKRGLMNGESLVDALIDMNERALIYRYGWGERGHMKDHREKMVIAPIATVMNESGRIRVLKKINCLLYQANEGQVPEEWLYKALYRIASELALEIVRESAEYDRAEGWN